MVGAILGDIFGSRFEFSKLRGNKSKNIELIHDDCYFTDDTVLTIATKFAIENNIPFADAYHSFGNKYPSAGWGNSFRRWLSSPDPQPYNSYGNGSAMRVSPIAYYINDLNEALEEAERSAICTHNHEEGVKGAVSTVHCIKLAQQKRNKKYIKNEIEKVYGYNLSRTLDEIRPTYNFYEICQLSVPESIICFLESEDYQDCIKNAISLGGDTDTMACIAGGIAEAYYGTTRLDNDVLLKRYLDDYLYNLIT